MSSIPDNVPLGDLEGDISLTNSGSSDATTDNNTSSACSRQDSNDSCPSSQDSSDSEQRGNTAQPSSCLSPVVFSPVGKYVKKSTAVAALVGVAITSIALWPSFAAQHDGHNSLSLAEWTSKKDFIEYCSELNNFNRTPECSLAVNVTLPAPPDFFNHLGHALRKRLAQPWTLLFINPVKEESQARHHVVPIFASTVTLTALVAGCAWNRIAASKSCLSESIHVHNNTPRNEGSHSEENTAGTDILFISDEFNHLHRINGQWESDDETDNPTKIKELDEEQSKREHLRSDGQETTTSMHSLGVIHSTHADARHLVSISKWYYDLSLDPEYCLFITKGPFKHANALWQMQDHVLQLKKRFNELYQMCSSSGWIGDGGIPISCLSILLRAKAEIVDEFTYWRNIDQYKDGQTSLWTLKENEINERLDNIRDHITTIRDLCMDLLRLTNYTHLISDIDSDEVETELQASAAKEKEKEKAIQQTLYEDLQAAVVRDHETQGFGDAKTNDNTEELEAVVRDWTQAGGHSITNTGIEDELDSVRFSDRSSIFSELYVSTHSGEFPPRVTTPSKRSVKQIQKVFGRLFRRPTEDSPQSGATVNNDASWDHFRPED